MGKLLNYFVKAELPPHKQPNTKSVFCVFLSVEKVKNPSKGIKKGDLLQKTNVRPPNTELLYDLLPHVFPKR